MSPRAFTARKSRHRSISDWKFVVRSVVENGQSGSLGNTLVVAAAKSSFLDKGLGLVRTQRAARRTKCLKVGSRGKISAYAAAGFFKTSGSPEFRSLQPVQRPLVASALSLSAADACSQFPHCSNHHVAQSRVSPRRSVTLRSLQIVRDRPVSLSSDE